MAKVKYQRGSLDSALMAAWRSIKGSDAPVYIFALAGGYRVANEAPVGSQAYYQMQGADGEMAYYRCELQGNEYVHVKHHRGYMANVAR
jgi:hypothetical protein